MIPNVYTFTPNHKGSDIRLAPKTRKQGSDIRLAPKTRKQGDDIRLAPKTREQGALSEPKRCQPDGARLRCQEWTLRIKYAQARDTGAYECQLSTHPPIGIIANLRVVREARLGDRRRPDLYAQEGSDVTLLCRLRNYTDPPSYVFWYHRDQMINYNSNRKVSVISQGGESHLKFKKVAKEDSGNYTCAPANAGPAHVTLHVITGESPAAVQRASAPLATAPTRWPWRRARSSSSPCERLLRSF
nr:limbic system-associated membrane protein-like [Penaeus vannamei]